MSAQNDLRQKAAEYRDHLMAELVRIEDFIAMADRLTASGKVVSLDFEMHALGDVPDEVH